MDEENKCHGCGRKMKLATIKDMDGLMIFYPYDSYICPKCLKHEVNKIIVGVVPA